MSLYKQLLKVNEEIYTKGNIKYKKISFSQYSLWAQCPLHWKLRYVDKIQVSEPSMLLVFGTSMHEAVQHYINTMFSQSIKSADSINLTEVLAEQIMNNYSKSMIDNNNQHFSTKEELNEFLIDGGLTLEYLQKHRKKYFTTKGYELIGIEVPIYYCPSESHPNIVFMGYIDLMIYDKDLDQIIIYDFKTSYNGWKDKDKSDEIKRRQLIFYKHFVSKILNIDPSKISVKFMILKRKVYEKSEYPIPRIQEIKPSDGPRVTKASIQSLESFINSCFNPDGTYKLESSFPAIKGIDNVNCKYCEFFNKYDICPKEQRKTI